MAATEAEKLRRRQIKLGGSAATRNDREYPKTMRVVSIKCERCSDGCDVITSR